VTKDLQVARKAKDVPHLRLRVESALLARLTKAAEKNERTLTGEIVDRLEASFRREEIQGYIDATVKKVSELFANTPDEVRRSLVDQEMFNLDLQVLCEMYPQTPREEHERFLREAAERRAARIRKSV
jgi:hypothetical protein